MCVRINRECFLILVLLSCVTITFVSIDVFYGNTNSWLWPILSGPNGPSRSPFAAPRPQQQWRPNPETIQVLLSQLNLTAVQSFLSLPLTLHTDLLLSNASLCRTQDGGPVDLLFIVHTAPTHLDRRLRMRRTFMSTEHFLPLGFRVRRVFLLGLVRDKELQEALEQEHRRFGDLVQGDFLDSYRNLTLKGVMGYGWMTRYCPHARLVIKTDDDVFFDTFKFFRRYWPLVKDKQRSIFCNVWRKNKHLIRRTGKWSVDKRLFSENRGFPYDYCSGLTVVITGDLVPWLFKAAEFAPFFWVDDVYLFGILPAVASNVSYVNLRYRDGVFSLRWTESLACLEDEGYNCPLLASIAHRFQLENMWNVSVKRYGESHFKEMRKPDFRV